MVDPLYEKYPDRLQRTYSRGTKRIDYILVDKTIVPSIERIGTLGLHDGLKFSDHVFIYMDCNEKKLFNGNINRPMHHPAREFKLEQVDRVEKFIKRFRELAEDRKLAEGVRKLAADFAKYGSNKNMVKRYQAMDRQICEYMIAAAQFIKGRCGYFRSPTLTDASVQLHFWKSIKSCKLNKTLPPAITIERSVKLNIDLTWATNLSVRRLKVIIRDARNHLWECQKKAGQNREEWFIKN